MKKIAVFGDPRMALEALSRFDKDACALVYAAQTHHDADFIAKQGFAAEVVDFRNDAALHALGIGIDVDYLFCFFSADSDNVFLTLSARAGQGFEHRRDRRRARFRGKIIGRRREQNHRPLRNQRT